METHSLELIFNCACEFYEELEIIHKKPKFTSYTIFINDLTNNDEFFNQKGIQISLCIDDHKKLQYLECFGIKQQIPYDAFKSLKKQFVEKYFEIENANNKHQLPKIEALLQKMKERREKHRVKILSDIIDVDIENVDNAQELLQMMIDQTLNERIAIRN